MYVQHADQSKMNQIEKEHFNANVVCTRCVQQLRIIAIKWLLYTREKDGNEMRRKVIDYL